MQMIRRVVVGYKLTSSPSFTVMYMKAAETERLVELPSAWPSTINESPRLEFFVQALDDRDNALFEFGNPSMPNEASLEAIESVSSAAAPNGTVQTPSNKRSLASQPLFWLAAGALVIGASAGIYLLTASPGAPSQAALTPALVCGPSEACR